MLTKGWKAAFLLICLGTLSGAGASPASQSPFRAGETIDFVGAGLQDSAEWREPSNWLSFEATVISTTGGNVTFLFQAEEVMGYGALWETYDLATRKSTTGPHHAVLWVNPDDIARGEAFLGVRLASLVATTPLFHQFSAGGTVYYYDVDTGILAHMTDYDNDSTALRL